MVPIFECPEVGEQCPVLILDKYFSKLPHEAFSNDIFFLHPIERHKDSKPWYSKMPVGKNVLEECVKWQILKEKSPITVEEEQQ